SVALLVDVSHGLHRHVVWVRMQTERGIERVGAHEANHVVLVIGDVDASVAEALGYIRSFRPESLHVVTPGASVTPDLAARWREFAGEGAPSLEPLRSRGLVSCVRTYVRHIQRGPSDVVTVMVPEMVGESLFRYLVGKNALVRLKAGLLREARVVVTDVPVVRDPAGHEGLGKPLIPVKTVALVFVSAV